MPPPGGSRQSINVSYNWGVPGKIEGNQDVVRQFKDVFQPDQGIFSPNFPLVPVESEYARLWDYPVGYNYIYTPRSYEPVTFAELRALAYSENLTRMAIETRKDQIERLEWEIGVLDDGDDDVAATADQEKRIKAATEFWRHPDGDRPFGTWLRELLEDMLAIDAPTLEVLRNRDGSIRALDIVDGSTIKLLIDHTGRRPKPPAPAFEQVIHGRPWRLFTADEIIYTPRNKRPGHIYGYSPVEQILMFINIALRRQVMQLNWFTEGNVPRGLITSPDGWSSKQIAGFQQWFDSTMAGNLSERSKSVWAPFGSKYQSIKDPPLKDEMDEWLARVVMFAFSLPPDAFIRQRNRSTSETARQTAQEEGLGPLLLWVKRLVDEVLQKRMGHKDLEFRWQELNETDPQVQATILEGYVKNGINTINEARDTLGLEPVEGGDDAMFVLATGPVLLKHADQGSEHTTNPPPPFNPMAAAGAPGQSSPRAMPGATNARTGARDGAANPRSPAGNRGTAAGKASAITAGARARFGLDAGRREAVDLEARQLLRRSRARRIEADLRALDAA